MTFVALLSLALILGVSAEHTSQDNTTNVPSTNKSEPDLKRTINLITENLNLTIRPLSILGFLHLIITYLCFNKLRNQIHINLVCLCLAFLLCDVTILTNIASKNSTEWCLVTAKVLHYLMLAAYTWLLALCYELFSSNVQSVWHGFNWSKMILFSALSWGIPAVLVTALHFLDVTDTVAIGYGRKYDNCWLKLAYPRMAVYSGPILFILVTSLIGLTWLVRKMKQQKKKASSVIKLNNADMRNFIGRCLSLIVFLLITEFFGFLVTLNQTGLSFGPKETNDIVYAFLRIIYIFLQTGRGLYLWVMFLISYRKVRDLFKDDLSKSDAYDIDLPQITLGASIETVNTIV